MLTKLPNGSYVDAEMVDAVTTSTSDKKPCALVVLQSGEALLYGSYDKEADAKRHVGVVARAINKGLAAQPVGGDVVAADDAGDDSDIDRGV